MWAIESSTLDFIFLFLFLNFIFVANIELQTDFRHYRSVCYCCLNNTFQYLNNIIRIFKYFFTRTYIHKITTLLEISYQTGPLYSHHTRLSNSNPNPKFLISHLPYIFSFSIHVFWITRRSFTSHKHSNFRQYS